MELLRVDDLEFGRRSRTGLGGRKRNVAAGMRGARGGTRAGTTMLVSELAGRRLVPGTRTTGNELEGGLPRVASGPAGIIEWLPTDVSQIANCYYESSLLTSGTTARQGTHLGGTNCTVIRRCYRPDHSLVDLGPLLPFATGIIEAQDLAGSLVETH